MNWIGLDIGGANLKAASSSGQSQLKQYPLWQNPNGLGDAICELLRSTINTESGTTLKNTRIAATMTGELADCFSSRREGVTFIVDAISSACLRCSLGQPVFVGTDLKWRLASVAKEQWLKSAASNWAAMATFSSRFLRGETGFIVDMGSTTTDIIPVREGNCVAVGKTDSQRLMTRELVYMGAGRTPVCSVCSHFEMDSETISLAREFFATTEDALVIAGYLSENEDNRNTADGRTLTIKNCSARLARMICEDAEQLSAKTIQDFAEQVVASMSSILTEAISKVVGPEIADTALLISGAGETVLERQLKGLVDDSNLVRLSNKLSPSLSAVAPAYAVAVLASEDSEL